MNRYYERMVRLRKKDYSETIETSMAKFRLKTQATTDEFKNSIAKFELIHRILDGIIEHDILYFATGQSQR